MINLSIPIIFSTLFLIYFEMCMHLTVRKLTSPKHKYYFGYFKLSILFFESSQIIEFNNENYTFLS